jgi:dextranase
VTNGTSYFYKVAAVNSAGTSPLSAEATAVPAVPTPPPGVPANLTAAAGNAQITLAWSNSSGATTYDLYRAIASGAEGSTAYKTGITATSYTDAGLTNGTPYFYTVAAVNSGGVSSQSNEATATPSAGVIAGVTTDLSRYTPGTTATITVSLANGTGQSSSGSIGINITHLGTLVESLPAQSFSLTGGGAEALTYTWATPSTDFTGYSVEVTATSAANTVVGAMNSAIDVSSTWTKFPRYGYMTTNVFGIPSPNAASVMNQMTRFHIDGLQYYNWEWKHHIPLDGTVSSPAASWINDGSGSAIYASAITSLINAGHTNNIVAMAYNSIYSALNGTDGFTSYTADGSGVSPSWGLYTTTTGVSGPASSFYQWQYMDPSNAGWEQYIVNQQMLVIQAFNFDGFHADTFGDLDAVNYTSTGSAAGVTNDACTTDTSSWGSTTTLNNDAGSPNFINGTFSPFLKYAKGILGNHYLIFNPVSYDHAHCEANTSPDDILYSELWANGDGFTTYEDLKQAIDTAYTESATVGAPKSMVAAAYVDYNPNSGAGNGFNAPDILLLDATLFASGGSHIELGDNTDMLNQQNFGSNSEPMSSSLGQSVGNYYDFLTAYENLLRDGQTNTSQVVSITGQTVNSTATPDTVWAFTKSDSTHEIIHFINLLGESSIDWQTGACSGCTYTSPHPVPTALTNVVVKYYNLNTVQSVSFASPDSNSGQTYNLPFSTGSDGGGDYVTFTLPSLAYWDMVYLNVN